jgi:hypothetical protein
VDRRGDCRTGPNPLREDLASQGRAAYRGKTEGFPYTADQGVVVLGERRTEQIRILCSWIESR